MGQFSCVVQEDSSALHAKTELEERLAHLHETHYPGDGAEFGWQTVPDGYMFTEGRQSTSSIIACVMDWETTLPERETYMRGVCDIWTDVTGCTDHEVVVAVTAANPV